MRFCQALSAILAVVGTVVMGAGAQGQEAAPPTLTLTKAIATALQLHPSLRAADQRVESARQRREVRRSETRLLTDFRLTAQRYDWLQPNKENLLGGGSTDVYADLGLRKLLYSGGRVEAQISAAELGLFRSRETDRRVRQQVVYGVARAYYQLVEAQRVVEARQEALRAMEQHAQLTRDLLAAGKVARVDVLRAEVKVADLRQALLKAQNATRLAKLALRNAMGVTEAGELVVLSTLAAPTAPPETGTALAEALSQRPDWLASQLAVRQAEADRTAAAAERKPSLSAVASYNSEGSDVPNLENWNVGFAVSLPVFDGGRIRAATREAEAELGARQAERELLRQQLELEVTGAVLRIQDALERVAATTKAVAEARETLNIQRRAYELGVGTALDVFDAQTALTQADVNHTQALTDAQTATAELTYAVGRDPQPQPEEQ